MIELALASLALAAPDCSLPSARTVATTPQVRVMRWRGRVVGCVRRTGRKVELRPSGCGDDCAYRRVDAAGRWATVVWAGSRRADGDGEALIETFDVVAGRRRASWGLYVVNLGNRPAWIPRVPALVTTAHGNAAFMIDGDQPGVWEVHRLRLGGHDKLDDGARIAARSLRRVRRRVEWTRAGVPQSASLP
jgi:hypothetical protein